ncbi:hypothetical protein T4A_9381 [Trichinella pseudospiralis]|uniref:Uncharacterized protein n=1 Tax=Trichinella pseudospiralis TaxID=6337 RepID=A0A0V1EZQ8_TRIPS|nr:hypothetical protein T4A_9381 [Trichinella pseudospiralis]
MKIFLELDEQKKIICNIKKVSMKVSLDQNEQFHRLTASTFTPTFRFHELQNDRLLMSSPTAALRLAMILKPVLLTRYVKRFWGKIVKRKKNLEKYNVKVLKKPAKNRPQIYTCLRSKIKKGSFCGSKNFINWRLNEAKQQQLISIRVYW